MKNSGHHFSRTKRPAKLMEYKVMHSENVICTFAQLIWNKENPVLTVPGGREREHFFDTFCNFELFCILS